MVKKRLRAASAAPAYYEIACVGGGPAGLVAAAACAPILASRGQQLALVERQLFTEQATTQFDGRTTAIAWQGRQLLTEIGLWAQLEPLAEPITTIQVADTFASPGLTFDSAELGADGKIGPFGHIVENRHLRRVLLGHLHRAPNVTIFNPASVTRLDTSGSLAELTLDNGKALQAALVLAADGRQSPLRAAAGIPTFDLAYDQQALVCVLGCAKPHRSVALEHFLPEGPFAILPMQDRPNGNSVEHLVSIVWTLKPATATALLALDEADFIEAMIVAGAGWLQPTRLVTKPAHYPLSLKHARRYTAPHLALVGEAAHAIHPIAGQGFNLGLRDIAGLRARLTEASRLGLRADDAFVLSDYERTRRADNQRMAGATDLLDRLFSLRQTGIGYPIARARQTGLAIVNASGPLRRFFMREAAGMRLRDTAA